MKKHTPLSIKQLLVMAALFLVFSSTVLFLFTFRQDEKRFTNITSRLFVEEMLGNTLNMHYSLASPENYGIHDYKPVLPVYSAAGTRNGQLAAENTLAALNALHTENLSDSDQFLCKLLTRTLKASLELNNYPYYREPLTPSSGMQTQLPILLAEYAFRSRQDVEDYLALLDQTDEYFASLLVYEREKFAAGLGMPASCLKQVREQCDTIVTKEALSEGTHFLQTTFRERLQELCDEGILSLEEAQAYLVQNDRLLKTVLLPAYTALGDGLILLEDESIPLTGLAALPEGREYYQALLVSETGSYRSVEEIQNMLTLQFSLVYGELQQLVTDHPELVGSYTAGDSASFPYIDAAQMLLDLQKRMAEDFPAIPDAQTSIAVKGVSKSLAAYCAPAFYLTAPLDDTSYNVIYINGQKTLVGLDLYTTLAHEGYPGHLYQTVYNNQTSSARGERPVRALLWYGGYLEGWALYTEFLSYDYASQLLQEKGMTQDALYAQIEKNNRSLQLCLYSMLDIMVHYENASYNQVAQTLAGFGIENESTLQAIYTYVALEPCNYLKYYLGYLEVMSLRAAAQELWGAEYTDYQFHSFLLDAGPADFTSLGERLASWELPQESELPQNAIPLPDVPTEHFRQTRNGEYLLGWEDRLRWNNRLRRAA